MASEQVTARLFEKEFIHRVGNFKDLRWLTRDGFDEIINKKMRAKEISKTVGNGLIKMSQAVSKRGSLKKYVDALKKYNESIQGKKIKKKDRKFPSLGTFFNYKKTAMLKGLMLPTIPANRSLKELPVKLTFRSFDLDELNWVIATYMLPYQSVTESAPELEPVKDLYDAILKFLYELYDQYNADNNAQWEAAIRQSEEIKQQIGL